MSKTTEKLYNEMVRMRKGGATYSEIQETLKVSKWQCMNYLKSVKVDKHFVQKEWEKAEEEANKVLIKTGYSHIVNLNNICPSPYWDYYAEKNKEKWLIDVTINVRKNIVDKILHTVKGYEHAILLKQDDRWKFIKLKYEEKELLNDEIISR